MITLPRMTMYGVVAVVEFNRLSNERGRVNYAGINIRTFLYDLSARVSPTHLRTELSSESPKQFAKMTWVVSDKNNEAERARRNRIIIVYFKRYNWNNICFENSTLSFVQPNNRWARISQNTYRIPVLYTCTFRRISVARISIES